MLSGQCPSSAVTGYEFTSHAQCVETGYQIAHDTFKNLEKLEDMNRDAKRNNTTPKTQNEHGLDFIALFVI